MQKNVFPGVFPVIDRPAASRALMLVLFAAGVGVWGSLLLAPKPAPLPPALVPSSVEDVDTAPVARWFGGAAAHLRVTVEGLIANAKGGAALLAVNGGAPQLYRVGDTLAPGVTLAAVQRDGVTIEQDGVIERVAAPARAAPLEGFVPVSKSRNE